MIIFIRNIPADTLRSEIIDFINPALKGGFFKSKGEIKNIEILTLKDKDINLLEHHALVHIEPDAAALRAIKKLHGQRFRGKRITVREFIVRNWRNNKRSESTDTNTELKEKRKNPERRRNLEIVEEARLEYSSRKSFHRYL
jgi:hypothetical protein